MSDPRTKEDLLKELEQMSIERDAALSQLKETRVMLQMVMDNLPQPIYWKDRQLRFMGCNKMFSELFDQENPEELIGLRENDVCTSKKQNPYCCIFEERELSVMAHGIPQYHLIDALKEGAERLWVDSSHVPLFRGGQIIGVLGTFEDITDRVENEEELNSHRDHLSELVKMRTSELERTNTNLEKSNRDLENANEALDKASRARSQFVANISHEIRTPLNAVMAMTELVLDTEISSVQREYLGTILESADSLLFTINDILDYSKIEAGKLSLESISFNLRETIESTMKALSVKAFQKGLELIIDIDPSVPRIMLGDPLRIRQIFSNLVSNAIKFTEQGEIRLKVEPILLDDKIIRLSFRVEDTGIGIPDERQKAIFNAFEQVDNSTTRNFGGSGLGLSIVSQLVELMDGEIALSSDQGKGSVFSLILQFGAVDGSYALRKRDPIEAFNGKNVLIIDDNHYWLSVLSSMLMRWGFNVSSICSMQSMERQLAGMQLSKSPPDLVIVDPVFDEGVDIIQQLIELQSQWNHKPKLLFTLAGGQHVNHLEKKPQFQKADFVFKPVVDFELASKIESLFERKNPARLNESMHPDEDIALDQLKVLLVDDREMNRRIGRALLAKFGCEVTEAHNGQEAIEVFKKGSFDVVLMDIQMPVMDGYQSAARIRKWEQSCRLKRTPILAVTANAKKDDIRSTMEAGMDDFVEKPIRIIELKTKLQEICISRECGFSDALNPASVQ